MEHLSVPRRSLIQEQTSDAFKEKAPLSSTGKGLLFLDKHKIGQPFGVPYLETNCELRQKSSTVQGVQSKSSENDRQPRVGRPTSNDDELVKHMSNLPGFLQRVEKENSIQEKALNFGVLDWKRLEKWKYNERMPGKFPKKVSSLNGNSFSSTSGQPPKVGPNLRKQRPSQGLSPSLLYTGKQPVPHGSRFSSPMRQPPSSHISDFYSAKEKRNITSRKEEKYSESVKSKGKETCSQDFQTAHGINSDGRQDKFHQKDKFYDRNCSKTNMDNKRKDLNKTVMSEKDASQLDQRKYDFSRCSHDKIDVSDTRNDTKLDDELDFATECGPADSQNIVLLLPKSFPKRNSSESALFTESRTSLDGQLAEALRNRLSDCFSPQAFYSGEFSDDVPHSCPLPSGSTDYTESATEPCTSEAFKAIDMDTCTFMPSEGKCSTVPRKATRPSSWVEASDKNHAGPSEQPNGKGRPPSPTRRFSFSLGRMTRSFSFKESSAVPQLSSEYTAVKSGPVRPEASTVMDSFEKDKANTSGRGRSSPLRRLLDPLLKHKGAASAETVRRPHGSSSPMRLRTTGTKEQSQGKKPEFSTFQALLQLSLKNGLPFFKLVVDNSSEMLAAVVKRLPISGKSDPCMIYTFYSVHEIRKKSMGWMSHGSKSKSCSLGYNVVGQMKISSSYSPKVKATDSSQFCQRECVLYGIDTEQADKQTPEYVPDKEIAAIIVKNSSEKLYDGTKQMHKMTFDTEEDKHCNGIVVILPSGVHGTPIEGAPSSLISRWRSGGSCDCGGWDVGCKLQILSDSEKNCNVRGASFTDRVSLFLQDGEQKKRPVFSLEPFNNGFYSIEMDASVSLLEAFATCVAYVTCQKFSEILYTKDQSDAVHFSEARTGTDKMKTPNTLQRQVSAKYVTCPPLSPAGRI